jgi:hypothetical protein
MLGTLLERAATWSNRPETLARISDRLTRVVLAVDAKARALQASPTGLPEVRDVRHELLATSIRKPGPPWAGEDLGECDVPGMVAPEECRYYLYLGRFYAGLGEVVELGPWLGRSTHYICHGLEGSPHFTGRKLQVYDDFVWRAAWMDDYVVPSDRPGDHADFLGLFEQYAGPIADSIDVQKRKIVTYDGNDGVEQLEWDGRPIEIIYVDCGRTFKANEAWWQIFEPAFLPGRTLVVLQDWATHREVPIQWYNQIKTWVDSKGPALQLVHELRHGGIATFLYRR